MNDGRINGVPDPSEAPTQRWVPADPRLAVGFEFDPTIVMGSDPTVEMSSPAADAVAAAGSGLRDRIELSRARGLGYQYEREGGRRASGWVGEIRMVFGQAASERDEAMATWDSFVRPVEASDLAGRVFVKTTDSGNVFLTGFNPDGTFWECTLDDPADQWTGRWGIDRDRRGEVALVATGPYTVCLLGSTESTALRGPEFTNGRPQSFVWLARLGSDQPAAPGSWAQGDEWVRLRNRALDVPRG